MAAAAAVTAVAAAVPTAAVHRAAEAAHLPVHNAAEADKEEKAVPGNYRK
jgi:hypothetical protein